MKSLFAAIFIFLFYSTTIGQWSYNYYGIFGGKVLVKSALIAEDNSILAICDTARKNIAAKDTYAILVGADGEVKWKRKVKSIWGKAKGHSYVAKGERRFAYAYTEIFANGDKGIRIVIFNERGKRVFDKSVSDTRDLRLIEFYFQQDHFSLIARIGENGEEEHIQFKLDLNGKELSYSFYELPSEIAWEENSLKFISPDSYVYTSKVDSVLKVCKVLGDSISWELSHSSKFNEIQLLNVLEFLDYKCIVYHAQEEVIVDCFDSYDKLIWSKKVYDYNSLRHESKLTLDNYIVLGGYDELFILDYQGNIYSTIELNPIRFEWLVDYELIDDDKFTFVRRSLLNRDNKQKLLIVKYDPNNVGRIDNYINLDGSN